MLFLSITLCIYLQLIYSGTSSDKRGLLRYCYMTTASSVVDIIVLIVLAEHSRYSPGAKYFCSVLWQMAACGVYFMFMKYIAGFGQHSNGKQRMLYAQNIFLGAFFYFQLVGHFTGANFSISPSGKIIQGELSWLLSYGFILHVPQILHERTDVGTHRKFRRVLVHSDSAGSILPAHPGELHNNFGERVLLLLPPRNSRIQRPGTHARTITQSKSHC